VGGGGLGWCRGGVGGRGTGGGCGGGGGHLSEEERAFVPLPKVLKIGSWAGRFLAREPAPHRGKKDLLLLLSEVLKRRRVLRQEGISDSCREAGGCTRLLQEGGG